MNHRKFNSLLKKLKNGKSEYFDDFYDLTKSSVFYIIMQVVHDSARTEDIMQETYVKFLHSMHQIDEKQNAFSYLLTIAKNKAVDEMRKVGKMSYIDFVEDIDDKADPYSKEYPLLNHCKSVLADDEFKILELTVILGYKRVEVAKMLNEPVSTINWKYNKILKKAKQFYKEVYNEL